MTKSLFFLLSLVSIFTTDLAHAAAFNNNGGAVIQCAGMSGPMVIDLWLAERDPHFELRKFSESEFLSAFEALKVLRNLDGSLYKIFFDRLAHLQRTHVLTDDPISSDLLTGAYFQDPNVSCDITFVAEQDKNLLLKIDATWWNEASRENKLALILHEVVFSYARQFGLYRADSVYKMVKFLLSAQSEKVTKVEFAQLLKELKWDGTFYTFVMQHPLKPESVVKNEDYTVRSGVLARDFRESAGPDISRARLVIDLKANTQVSFKQEDFVYEGRAHRILLRPVPYRGCEMEFSSREGLSFRRSDFFFVDQISQETNFESIKVFLFLNGQERCETLPIAQSVIDFHSTGFPKMLHFKNPILLTPRYSQPSVKMQGDVTFYDNGAIASGTVAEDTLLDCNDSGSKSLFTKGSKIEFDEMLQLCHP